MNSSRRGGAALLSLFAPAFRKRRRARDNGRRYYCLHSPQINNSALAMTWVEILNIAKNEVISY